MPLTHYIIVRRDMPLGVVCAQVTHAAGESFYIYGERVNEPYEPLDIEGTVAVVLGVRNEKSLLYYHKRLYKARIAHIPILENAGPFAGQYTAIGVLPTTDRASVRSVLKKLMPLSDLTMTAMDRPAKA